LLLLSTFHLVSFLGVVSFSATRQTSNSSESLVSLRCCKRPSFIPNGNRISLLEIDSRHARKTKFNTYMSLHEEGKSQLPLRQFQDAVAREKKIPESVFVAFKCGQIPTPWRPRPPDGGRLQMRRGSSIFFLSLSPLLPFRRAKFKPFNFISADDAATVHAIVRHTSGTRFTN
jgi:hypothetical protein